MKTDPHEVTARRAILDRIVDAMAQARGWTLDEDLRRELRDAVEVSYQSIFRTSAVARGKPTRDAVELLLLELYAFDNHDHAAMDASPRHGSLLH